VPLLYGVTTGIAVGAAARAAKVRGAGFVALAGLGGGLLAVYFGWVAWLLAWSDFAYISTFSSFGMWTALGEAAAEGIWYFDEFELEGGALYFWWTVEALLIIGFSAATAFAMVEESSNTFCEACGDWAKNVYTSPELNALEDEEDFKARLEADPESALADFRPVTPKVPGVTFQFAIQACEKCWNFLVLDVRKIEHSEDKEGNQKRKQSDLVDNLLIDKPLFDRLARSLGQTTEEV
jgi:hypothetical protein